MNEALREIRVASDQSPRNARGSLICRCSERLLEPLREIYAGHDWVYDFLLAQESTELLRGRRPVASGRVGEIDLVVKRLFHGGKTAWLWRDGFLSSARFQNHLDVARFLIDRGIKTPPVHFATWRESGVMFRGEVGVEKLPEGKDADRFLFNAAGPPAEWRDVASQIGEMVASLHRIEFFHQDLNLMNFYITRDRQLFILDLDKSSISKRVLSSRTRERNLARLERSIRKQGRDSDPAYVDELVRTVHMSYATHA